MSIITNALKKAQEKRKAERNTRPGTVPDYSPKKNIITSNTTHERVLSSIIRYKLLLIMLLLGVALTLATGVLLFSNRSTRDSSVSVFPKEDILKTEEKTSVRKQARIQTVESSYSGTLPFLNGIMYSPTSPYAVINDRMVSEGETVAGFTVVKIYPDKVTLSKEKNKIELKLR